MVPVVNILELSGAGASVGTNMEMGIELAVSEINSKGGILGRKIAATTFDSQTNVTIARSLAQRAVDMNAYAVIGPVFSGSVLASMVVTAPPRFRTLRVRPQAASLRWVIHTFSGRR